MMSLHDQRKKWRTATPNLQKGDLVLVRDKNLHRYLWGTAEVIDVKISRDGLVRSVTIQPLPRKGDTRARPSPRERPVHDLVLLQLILERCLSEQPDEGQQESFQGPSGTDEGEFHQF